MLTLARVVAHPLVAEPLAAFEGPKHTCARMLTEHNRRRRERYAEDRLTHAAEQHHSRDRSQIRRTASTLAPHRWESALDHGDEEEEYAYAAPPHEAKPRAVWGAGGPHHAAADAGAQGRMHGPPSYMAAHHQPYYAYPAHGGQAGGMMAPSTWCVRAHPLTPALGA